MLSCLVRLEEDFLHTSKIMMVHSLNFCPRIIWLMFFAWFWNCFYASAVIVEKMTDTFFTCLHGMVKRLDSFFYLSNFSWIEIGVSYFHHVLKSLLTNSGRLSETRVFGTPNISKIANRLFWKYWVVLSLFGMFRSSLFMHQQQPICFLTLWLGPIP